MMGQHVIIVGSGMAALVTAIKLSTNKNVKIFTKNFRTGGNSWRAQGGIAAAIGDQDHPFEHLQDTLNAGCFHNDKKMVEILVNEGVPYLKHWIETGMEFDNKDGELSLGIEGAHRKRRIVHAGGDQTGFHLMKHLHQQIAMSKNIEVFENETIVDLLIASGECQGILTKDDKGIINKHYAVVTILATGGCGGIFEATSNDPEIVGDGIALAYRAGGRLSDLEFMQFHPTLIQYKSKIVGLASEALRGEGARLVDKYGNYVMEGEHPLKDLAPRDVVARVIERETNKGNQIYLDITAISNFEKRFPAIYSMCKNSQIPLEDGKIPVVIGAHFLMGGVVTDSFGQTTVPRLFAVGEVARTGVHGANRLASNSLLEALVFSERAGEYILQEWDQFSIKARKSLRLELVPGEYKSMPSFPSKKKIQLHVSRTLGVERTGEELKKLVHWLEGETFIQTHLFADRQKWSKEQLSISNMLITTWLMATAALKRKESIGAHYRVDYPSRDSNWQGKQIIHEKTAGLFLQRGKTNEQATTERETVSISQ